MQNEILTPQLVNINSQETKPLSASWSPIGVFRKTDAVLSILSNSGNVELQYEMNYGYKCSINLTEEWVTYQKKNWVEISQNESHSKICDIHKKRIFDCIAKCK